MSTILFAGDSYAVADPEHKHHGEIIAEHFGLKCKLEGIPFSDVQANGYVTIGRIMEDPKYYALFVLRYKSNTLTFT